MAEWIYNDYDNVWECPLCRFYWRLNNAESTAENGISYCPKCGVKIERFELKKEVSKCRCQMKC